MTGKLGFVEPIDSTLLFYMAVDIGIGVVKLWEASFVIAVWRTGTTRPTRS